MTSNISKLLKRLNVEDTGIYDNRFYVVNLEDSNAYAKMYSNLSKVAINTEFPDFGTNTADSTVKVTNYFEVDEGSDSFNLFLIANFAEDKYYLKIGEK